MGIGMRMRIITRFSVVTGLAAVGLMGCGQKVFTIPVTSMEPTIKSGSPVLVDITFYDKNPIQRFDIVAVKDPDGKGKKYVKRIIGLGGERVAIERGAIFIDDIELREPFNTIPPDKDFGPIVVPENEYFVLGDNRPNSYDSRYWKRATLKKDDIIGKVTLHINKQPKGGE